MTEVRIPCHSGELPAYVATPQTSEPCPGVVVIHDILGMSRDLKNQADWLASEDSIPRPYRSTYKIPIDKRRI